jgi:type IV secretion system protein VirB8
MSDPMFELAQTWDQDLYRSLELSRRRAWIVAGASAAFAGLALLAVVLLLPLKESVPYVITKDAQTGFIEVARSVDDTLGQDEALARFHLLRYVSARETYDPADLQTNYELVYALSGRSAWESYDPLFRRGTPGNLLERYGRRTRVEVRIKSVSMLATDQALVRFATTRRTGSSEDVEHWAATVRFAYARSAKELRDGAKNPLGFEVVAYQRDQEVVSAGS